jgi:hypothetical protein
MKNFRIISAGLNRKLNLNPPAVSNTTSRPGFGGLDVF